MDIKQELLGTAYKKAMRSKQKIAELNISSDMEEEAIEVLVLKMAKDKATLLDDGTKPSALVGNMEWYIRTLIDRAKLFETNTPESKQEILQLEYDELNIENSSFDELASML